MLLPALWICRVGFDSWATSNTITYACTQFASPIRRLPVASSLRCLLAARLISVVAAKGCVQIRLLHSSRSVLGVKGCDQRNNSNLTYNGKHPKGKCTSVGRKTKWWQLEKGRVRWDLSEQGNSKCQIHTYLLNWIQSCLSNATLTCNIITVPKSPSVSIYNSVRTKKPKWKCKYKEYKEEKSRKSQSSWKFIATRKGVKCAERKV